MLVGDTCMTVSVTGGWDCMVNARGGDDSSGNLQAFMDRQAALSQEVLRDPTSPAGNELYLLVTAYVSPAPTRDRFG